MMKKLTLRLAVAAALLVLGGGVYGLAAMSGSSKPGSSGSRVVCPLTGEELPCPNCCPLNR